MIFVFPQNRILNNSKLTKKISTYVINCTGVKFLLKKNMYIIWLAKHLYQLLCESTNGYERNELFIY